MGTEKKIRVAKTFDGLAGRKLGGYTIVDHLASGGMAEIFLARHQALGGFEKELVIKLLQERFSDKPQVVTMFRDEARIAAKLNHPAIVDVFDIGEQDGLHYIAMEHIDGRTLTDVIRRGLEVSRPLPLGLAAFVCAQVAEGLAYMGAGQDRKGKALRVVHRDISPTNIIIGERGHTKIIDFGVATDHGEGKEEEARPGKYSYMSPEQVRGEKIDGRSDVFSLGIILYEITLGRRLFRGAPQTVMKRIVEDRVRPPTFVNRDYPPQLEAIVMRALEKRREDRYPSGEELGRDLDAFLAGLPERVGERQVAAYLRAIDAEDAVVSDVGTRRADTFIESDDPVEEEEELDLDRAPAGWRVVGPTPDVAKSSPSLPSAPQAAAAPAAPMPTGAGVGRFAVPFILALAAIAGGLFWVFSR